MYVAVLLLLVGLNVKEKSTVNDISLCKNYGYVCVHLGENQGDEGGVSEISKSGSNT